MKTKPKYQSRMTKRSRLKGEPVEIIETRDGQRLGVYGFDKENGESYFTPLGWISSRQIKRKLAFDIEADNSQVMMMPFADPSLTAPKSRGEERLSANAHPAPATPAAENAASAFGSLFDSEMEVQTAEVLTATSGQESAGAYEKPYISYVITSPKGVDSVITDVGGKILGPVSLQHIGQVREYLKTLVADHGPDQVKFDYKIEA